MHVVFHAADSKGQQIMVFADGRRVSPQARQKVAGKYLLPILGAEDQGGYGFVRSCGTCVLRLGGNVTAR
jgi:hypothetical protein